jgi:hypothetical protein
LAARTNSSARSTKAVIAAEVGNPASLDIDRDLLGKMDDVASILTPDGLNF